MLIKITKKSVRLVQNKLYQITLNLQYLDGVNVLINQDFTQEHRLGDNPSIAINKFQTTMQSAIDNYKAEQVILVSSVLDNAITALQSGLTP